MRYRSVQNVIYVDRRESSILLKTSCPRGDSEGKDFDGGDGKSHSSSLDSAAHGELERVIVQRLTAVRFDDNGGADLQAGFEIAGNRIGLDDVDHVLDKGPRL